MKTDESLLLRAIVLSHEGPYHKKGLDVVSIGVNLKMNHKRLLYICQKWTDKKWYEYGVSATLGWLTPEGYEIGRREIERISTL